MRDCKKKFLEQVKFDRDKYDKFILDMLDNELNERSIAPYKFNVGYNAHKSGGDINFGQIEDFCETVYEGWYDTMQSMDAERYDGATRVAIEKFQKNKNKYAPEKVNKSGFYNFFDSGFDEEFEDAGLTPAFVQGFWGNKGIGYLHVFQPVNMPRDKTELRLHLNLKQENIVPFANAMYQKAIEDKLPLSFMVASSDVRNDTYLLYTSYEHAQQYIDLIEEIKKEQPKLLQGTEKVHPMLGVINGYIGVGEEPRYIKSSVNEECKGLSNMCNKELAKAIKGIVESNNCVENSCGEILTVDEYMEDYIRQNLIEKCEKEYDDVMKNKTVQGESLNEQELENYKKGMSAYIEELKNNEKLIGKFESIANGYKDYVKQRSMGSLASPNLSLEVNMNASEQVGDFVRIHAAYNNLWHQKDEENNIIFYENVSKNALDAELLRMFPDEKRKLEERVLTPAVQALYLKTGRVSASYPYLNTETARELDEACSIFL